MRVKSVQREWEEFARTNPLWAILTDPARKQHWDPVEFFETGHADVERLLSQLDGLKLKVTFGRALDFGCGVGRVSRALGTRFESVVGLDISHEMIRLARGVPTETTPPARSQ